VLNHVVQRLHQRAQPLSIFLLIAAVSLTACQQPPVKPYVPPPIQTMYHRDVTSAVDFLARTLAQQLLNVARPTQSTVPVEEFFSTQSAEVSTSGRALQQQLASTLSSTFAPMKFVPLDTASASTAQWVLLANYATPGPNENLPAGKWVRLQIAMVESSTSRVLTRIDTYLDAAQFNAEPTQFFKDAPMYFTDERHRQRVGAMSGQPQLIANSLQIQSELSDAIAAYEASRFAEAEQGFIKVRALAANHPGALTGLYQTYWKLGRKSEAEQAFSDLVAAGIDAGSLSVKLLFKVGGTAFVDSADLSTQYRLWLKSVGQVASSKDRCVDVTGHASKSGAADYNDRLSLQRAESIVALIAQTSRDARTRFKSAGRGFQETIVGTGANDATDAIDRRVEFKVKNCDKG
jgi:outer membrane protein OmpA-like peptidoglycan-associated protein